MNKKLFLAFIVICSVGLLAPVMAFSNSAITKLRKQLNTSTADTTKINILFKMGYEFIDGPSDSLLLYFGEALEIIDRNLDEYLKQEKVYVKEISQYRLYKIRALIEFGIEYFFRSDYQKALAYYFEALEVAKLHGDIGMLSECYSEIGIVYKNQGDFDLALEYYEQAYEMAKQIADTSWIASCQVNMGNIYKEKGYLIIAQKYYMDALSIMEKLGHDRRIAACYQSIGDIYNKQRDYGIALEYYSRSLVLAKKTNDKVRETTCYLNIGYVYINMKQYKAARDFLEKAIVLYDKTGYQHELDNGYILMGDTYLNEEEFDTAIEYYYQALEISQRENDKISIAEIEGKLGTAYLKTNKKQQALQLFINSLAIADSIGSLVLMMDANTNLYQYYEDMGQAAQALQYHKEHDRLKDSLFNAEKYKAIMEMEVKYNSEKKEQELALLTEKNEVQKLKLNRRNRVYFTSLIGIGFLFIIGYFLFRNRQLRAIHNSIELEQKLMRSQMNPHFIFNSLIAIQSYIYKQEAVKAGDYLARFAELIRITLENSRGEFVLLEKEIKMLNAYLELQELRFENKFTYQIEIDKQINVENILIPPMLAQPFVENSIEHGLRHRTEIGNLIIKFKKQHQSILCTIEDNGVGRETSRKLEQKREHQSMATSITKERLNILSKKYRNKYLLEIIDLKDASGSSRGTRVTINLPFKGEI